MAVARHVLLLDPSNNKMDEMSWKMFEIKIIYGRNAQVPISMHAQ
jgi:hypothetical protein